MATSVPESWRDRAFQAGEQSASGQSISDVLPAHDDETTSSSKTQHRLEKQVNRVHYDRYIASLEQLRETNPPRGTGDPLGEKETRGFAKARQRSQSGPGATILRARLVDSSRIIPAPEFLYAGRCFLGMEEFLATRYLCCGATDADTRHACAIDRERRSTSTSPWYTCSPAPSNAWQFTTRWKAELRSAPTGISAWTSSSRGEASAMLRHRSIEMKRYFST